ncbi:MAG: oligosaccharide flippase family protein [Proteobacteria bacterium]|nr:oligosaccharide flippase family protein [Pseudomonadota bacterium]
MKFFIFSKPSDSFSGNILKLVTGTTLAQALGILISPIVTRLFAPEAYGVAALFSSITAIIGVIVCLRYELAIMLPKTDEEAANVLAVSLCSTLMITALSALVIVFAKDQILQLTNTPQLAPYLWIVPLSVFLSGVFTSLNYWNSRTKHFGRLSVIQVVSSITTQATKLTAGLAGFVSGGVLIVTSMLGGMVSTGALAGQMWREDKKLFIGHVRWRGIADGFIRFRKFPIIDTWGGLLNAISWQLPALMLASFFSLSVVGFYAFGLTVLQVPLSIIYGALAQVFYQRACEEKNVKGANGELVENLMDKLMFIGILPTMVLTMVSEELFAVVFGGRWVEAGRYAQILAPWIFFWFISSPLSTLFLVYERQGAALSVNSIIFITRVISLYIGGIYHNIDLALGLFSVTGIAAYAFYAAWNIRLAQANGKRILFNFFKHSLNSLPVLLCLFLVKYTFQFSPIVILSSALFIVTFYFFIFRSKYISLLSALRK